MRIFELNTFCGIKSTGRIATDIATLVEKQGGECLIGYGAETVPKHLSRFAYRIGEKWGRKIHAARRKLLDQEGYGSRFATRRLIRKIKDFAPDVIHLHNIHGCYLHFATLFAYLKESKIPVVWTLHDCWTFTGHCAYFDAVGCQKWRTECHHCVQQKSYPINQGLDGSRRNHRKKKQWFGDLPNLTIVTPCEWLMTVVDQSHMAYAKQKVIINGVDLKTFHPVKSDIRARYQLEDHYVVLSIASEWDDRKGLPYLIKAAQNLGDAYRFVVIGLSEEQVSTLPSQMIGITHTQDVNELASWYTTADCFANPTLEDNMPMVNLEALACGTPVVVFDTGGCPEAVDEHSGIVVEKGNQQALQEAIVRCCESKNDERQTQCLARAELFSADRTFQQYIELYEELSR